MLRCWHKNIFLFIKDMTQDLMGEIYCYAHVHDSLFAKYLKSARKLLQKWLLFIGIWARLCFYVIVTSLPFNMECHSVKVPFVSDDTHHSLLSRGKCHYCYHYF